MHHDFKPDITICQLSSAKVVHSDNKIKKIKTIWLKKKTLSFVLKEQAKDNFQFVRISLRNLTN